MATKTRYTTIGGEIIAEKRNGVRREYVPDPLGSTVALLDNTQVQVNTFTYWPYGEIRRSTGTTPPPFQFVGTVGYYSDSATRVYIRSRYFDVGNCRWITQDLSLLTSDTPNLYEYVFDRPVVWVDRYGLLADTLPPYKPQPPPPYKYDPPFWNGIIQTYNNCYCYALNNPCGDVECSPGDFSGGRYNNCPNGHPSCNNLLANAKRDGMISVPPGGCPSGWHKVMLFAGPPTGDCTWHWYRQDPGGGWSNKDGPYPATNCYSTVDDNGFQGSNNPITDPRKDAPNHGTPVLCGSLCARDVPVKRKKQ